MRIGSQGDDFENSATYRPIEMRGQQKALPLDKIAACLVQLSNRLGDTSSLHDESLRSQFGGAVAELGALRDVIAARLASDDTRAQSLARIDAALVDLNAVLSSLIESSHSDVSAANVLAFPRKPRGMDAKAQKMLRRAILTLGVSAAAAGVGFAAPAAAEDAATPTYIGMTPQDIGVMQRPRPEYDAKGIPLGAFRMFPSLDVNATYDDNVFRT